MLRRFQKVWMWGLIVLVGGFILGQGCGQKSPHEMKILVRESDTYAKWLQDKLSDLGKSFSCKIVVSTYSQDEDLLDMLNLQKDGHSNKIGVVEVPLELSRRLLADKMIIPLSKAVSEERLNHDLKAYNFKLFPIASNARETALIPERGNIFLMAYLKLPVKDVLRDWKLYRREFSFVLQKYNHWGLPSGYTLEADPEKWDFYDLTFMAYYWAAKPYHSLLIPRVAHRGGPTTEALNDLSTRIFELGASTGDLFNPLNESMVDALQWESIFIKEGYYNPEMWENDWSGSDLISEFLNRHIFLTYFNQSQLFTLLGSLTSDTLRVPIKLDDIGIAALPKGCSVILGHDLVPERPGKKTSGFYMWSLGIPSKFRNPQLAYKVIQFMTGENLQQQQMNEFGFLPSRKNILAESDSILDKSWKKAVFRVLKKQLVAGVQPFPSDSSWNKIGALYLAAWQNICVEKQITQWKAVENALKPLAKDVEEIKKIK